MALKDELDSLERRAIREALGSTDGNVAAAGRQLGMEYYTLWRRLKHHKINPRQYRGKLYSDRYPGDED